MVQLVCSAVNDSCILTDMTHYAYFTNVIRVLCSLTQRGEECVCVNTIVLQPAVDGRGARVDVCVCVCVCVRVCVCVHACVCVCVCNCVCACTSVCMFVLYWMVHSCTQDYLHPVHAYMCTHRQQQTACLIWHGSLLGN